MIDNSEIGFLEGDLEIIQQIISKFPTVAKACIYGSRANGKFKHYSDVDIAVWFNGEDKTRSIAGILNDESPLPYKFDVLNYETIKNANLKKSIDEFNFVIV